MSNTPAKHAPVAAPSWLVLLILVSVAATLVGAIALVQPNRRWVHPASSDWNAAWWEWASSDTARISLNRNRGIDPQTHAVPNVPAAGELLVFGNSAAREAFDAAAFTKSTGVKAHNFGLTTVRAIDFVNAGFAPAKDSTVILLLNGAAMDDRLRVDPDLPWNRAIALPSIISERREIAGLVTARGLEAARRVLGREGDPERAGLARRVYRYDRPLDEAALAEQLAEVRAWYGGEEPAQASSQQSFAHIRADAAAVSELCARAQAEGWRLIVAWLPARNAEVDALFAAHREALAAALSLAGAADNLWSLTPIDASDYHDVGHVLASGRTKFTLQMVQLWKHRGA